MEWKRQHFLSAGRQTLSSIKSLHVRWRSVWSRIQEPTATIGARILRCGPEMAGKGMKDSEKEEAKNEIAVEAMILVRHPNSTAVRCDLKSRQIAIPRRAIT